MQPSNLLLWNKGRPPADSQRVAAAAKAIKRGRDVYVYFDNDAKVHAPFDAMKLIARLQSLAPGAVVAPRDAAQEIPRRIGMN